MAKAESEGIHPAVRPRGLAARGRGTLDTLGFFGPPPDLPEQVAGRRRRGPRHRRSARGRRHRQRGRVRHGRQRIAGDVLPRVAGPFMPVPVVVVQGRRAARVRERRTLVFAVSFSGTPRRPSSRQRRPPPPAAASSPSPRAARCATWSRRPGPVVPSPPGIPMPAPGGCPGRPAPASCSTASGCSPARRRASSRRRPARRRRDAACRPDGNPARPGPPHRPHHPDRLRRGGLGAVAAHALEGPRQRERQGRPRSGTPSPSSPTTRCAAGASTATSPARFHARDLRHDHEHPRSRRRFDLVREVAREVVAGVARGAGRGRRAAGPAARPDVRRRLGRLYLAAQAGVDPGPIPALDDIKAALADEPTGVGGPAARERRPG